MPAISLANLGESRQVLCIWGHYTRLTWCYTFVVEIGHGLFLSNGH